MALVLKVWFVGVVKYYRGRDEVFRALHPLYMCRSHECFNKTLVLYVSSSMSTLWSLKSQSLRSQNPQLRMRPHPQQQRLHPLQFPAAVGWKTYQSPLQNHRQPPLLKQLKVHVRNICKCVFEQLAWTTFS